MSPQVRVIAAEFERQRREDPLDLQTALALLLRSHLRLRAFLLHDSGLRARFVGSSSRIGDVRFCGSFRWRQG